ncbi:MAG TPA: zinc-binding alcohol dehydrogenase family protein [Puia sp.]|nr:zinc-binding alcohol dehydrogenase family protein [Puia sp.]
MKAAVLYSKDGAPQYADMPEPMPQNDDEILVSVKAVALKHFDTSRAKGAHYSSEGQKQEARIIGGDGICMLPDGSRVYALGASGMMAERATVEKDRVVPVPAGLDDITAAALPNAVIGAAMALRFRAGIEPGDTVLVNGATGFTGRVAVQIARHYGAGRIIATGRNAQSLQELQALGADEILPIDGQFIEHLFQIHQRASINVVIDYLWGHTAEMILTSLKGKGSFTPHMRFVSVGAMTGDTIQLSAANLRSADLQLLGSGLGSWTKQQVRAFFTDILPEMFRLAAEGRLKAGTVEVALGDIEKLWDVEVPGGRRLVVRI